MPQQSPPLQPVAPPSPQRNRPLSQPQWRAFEAMARHLNFGAAASELHLSQSAVSRQIQALEDEVGVTLFTRDTRNVQPTAAGRELLEAIRPALERVDSTVRNIRRKSARKSITITTWASFATSWLIARMEGFQTAYPDIDIHIDATDAFTDLSATGTDLALRYAPKPPAEPHILRLFTETLSPAASPWLLRSLPSPGIRSAQDLQHLTLIETRPMRSHQLNHWLQWHSWLQAQGATQPSSNRWLYFNYTHQAIQAALTGQGVVLARMPLIADSLASGELVEILPTTRIHLHLGYWLITSPHSVHRPEITAFRDWLATQAQQTRNVIGES